MFVLYIFLLLSSFTADRKEAVTIFMIGDSTMANKNLAKGNIERGWGQMLPGYLTEDAVVNNHAVNGRSTLSFINEGRWEQVLSKIHQGDYVFIQFGHNDEKLAEDLHTEPGSTFDANLKRFVNDARDKGGIPVLFNSIVRRNFPPEGATGHQYSYEKEGAVLVDTHGEYANAPRRVAKELNVPFIDMNKLTHDLMSGMGTEKSKELFMWVPAGKYGFSPKGRVDNTHLNIYGARITAGIAIDAVVKEVPALAPYVRHNDLVVAKDGSGDFFTVQEAVGAAYRFQKDSVSILIRPGIYREKVNIANSKPAITLVKQKGAVVEDSCGRRMGITDRLIDKHTSWEIGAQ
ncbi:MAG: pectinesterase family protein [Breznakibacter sp.]